MRKFPLTLIDLEQAVSSRREKKKKKTFKSMKDKLGIQLPLNTNGVYVASNFESVPLKQ